jgi:hypothetical protein
LPATIGAVTEAYEVDEGESAGCKGCVPAIRVGVTDNDVTVEVFFHSSGCASLEAMPAEERVSYPDAAAVVVHLSEDQTRDWPAGEG